MKKIMIGMVVFFLAMASVTFADIREDILKEFYKMEARCEAGITYIGHADSLANIGFKMKEYNRQKKINKYEPIKSIGFDIAINAAYLEYEFAQTIWRWKVQFGDTSHYPAMDLYKAFYKFFPDSDIEKDYDGRIFYMDMISYAWGEASKHVKKAENELTGNK